VAEEAKVAPEIASEAAPVREVRTFSEQKKSSRRVFGNAGTR
jgi:hypothetical protein